MDTPHIFPKDRLYGYPIVSTKLVPDKGKYDETLVGLFPLSTISDTEFIKDIMHDIVVERYRLGAMPIMDERFLIKPESLDVPKEPPHTSEFS